MHETAVDQFVDIKKNEAIGQDSLFADLGGEDGGAGFGISVTIPDLDEWDKMTLLAHERDMLGLYVSDHPLLGLEHVLANGTDMTIGRLLSDESVAHGHHVTIAGLITNVNRRITKKGDPWATITVEDLEGEVEVLLWPSIYVQVSSVLAQDAIIRVKAGVDKERETVQLRGLEVSVPDLTESSTGGPVVISMPSTRCTPPVVQQLRDVLATHPGMTEVRLRLLTRSETRVLRLDEKLRVTPSGALFADLKQLLGPGCLGG